MQLKPTARGCPLWKYQATKWKSFLLPWLTWINQLIEPNWEICLMNEPRSGRLFLLQRLSLEIISYCHLVKTRLPASQTALSLIDDHNDPPTAGAGTGQARIKVKAPSTGIHPSKCISRQFLVCMRKTDWFAPPSRPPFSTPHIAWHAAKWGHLFGLLAAAVVHYDWVTVPVETRRESCLHRAGWWWWKCK